MTHFTVLLKHLTSVMQQFNPNLVWSVSHCTCCAAL